jgi:hypothetical protein
MNLVVRNVVLSEFGIVTRSMTDYDMRTVGLFEAPLLFHPWIFAFSTVRDLRCLKGGG